MILISGGTLLKLLCVVVGKEWILLLLVVTDVASRRVENARIEEENIMALTKTIELKLHILVESILS
jgi:hypothetical protein